MAAISHGGDEAEPGDDARVTRFARWTARLCGALVALFYLWLLVLLGQEDAAPGSEPISVMAVVVAAAVAVAWRFPRAGGALTVAAGLALWGSVIIFGERIAARPLVDAALSFFLFGLPVVVAGLMLYQSGRWQLAAARR